MRHALGAGFIAINLGLAWLLNQGGLDAGKALGIIALFYVFMLPCAIVAAWLISPYTGGPVAITLALAAAAWLSWASVTSPGSSPELDEPGTCFDRQGSHRC